MEETKRRTVEIKGKSPGYKAGRCVYIPKEPGPTFLQEQSLPAPKALSLAIGDIRTTLELWRASLLRRVRGALAGISLRESSLGSAWVRWKTLSAAGAIRPSRSCRHFCAARTIEY
jgi:hypothetical protein